MATHIVSTSVSFVKQHPLILCCLLLPFIPPVYRLLLFFTPLLASTALCVLALVSWVPNQGGQNTSDKKLNRLFDDAKEEAQKNSKRAEGGCSCLSNGECERSAPTRDEAQWIGDNLLEGSSHEYQERLEERQEAIDGERDGHGLMENSADGERDGLELMDYSAEGRSDDEQLQEAMDLDTQNDRGEIEDDERDAIANESDAEILKVGSSGSEGSNEGGIQVKSPRMRELQVVHGHEKVIAKLKMAMEREVAALEASLLSPQMPTTELSKHCREEEHHHHIPTTQEPHPPIS